MKKLIIIDGNSLIHRAFHALPDTLKTKDGTLTNAAYGFLLVFLSVLDKFNPDYVAAAFDRKGKTFRHKLFKEYKANRKKAPEELYRQIPIVKEILENLGIPRLSVKGLEADDVIGILAKSELGDNKDMETIIVTGDNDALQLVDEKTKVFTLRKGVRDTVVYDRSKVKEKFSLRPDQIVDFKALAGDSSDNIPGVPGVGPKTAQDLLKKYDNLEKIYKNLKNIKSGIAEKLKKSKEKAFLSQRLAKIQTHGSVNFNLKKARPSKTGKKQLKKILEKYEFTSLIKKFNLDNEDENSLKTKKSIEENPENKNRPEVLDLKNETPQKTVKTIQKQIKKSDKIFLTIWEKPLEKIMEKEVFDCNLKYLFLAGNKKEEIIFIKIKQTDLKHLKKIKESLNAKKLIGYGLKKELEIFSLQKTGLEKMVFKHDLKILDYLLNAGKNHLYLEKKLKPVDKKSFYQQMIELKKGQTKLSFDQNPNEQENITRNYLAQKLKVLTNNFKSLKDNLEKISKNQSDIGLFPVCEKKDKEKYNLKYIYNKIEIPLIKVLAQMELTGILVDKKILKKLEKDFKKQTDKLKQKVFKLSGEEFNLDSSQQLSRILYEKLKLSTNNIKKGKSGFYSTSQEALEILSQKYEIASYIVKYRELTKLINTYVKPFPKLINNKTGRLHTSFNQEKTTTGRLSSSNPNLQNIPIRTSEGRKIRKAFTAPKGYCLLSCDYSQIELRIAAHYSKDKTMIETFRKKGDIHSETAARIHKIKKQQVSKKLRRTAKELNFGIIYGMGVYGFAKAANISREEAKKFIENYKNEFPQMFDYLDQAKDTAKEMGYVETYFGRRRYVEEIHSGNWQLKAAGERMAINMPLQGTAADIMKLAIIKVNDYLIKNNLTDKIKMLLTVHDEILFQVKISQKKSGQNKIILDKEVKKELSNLKNIMENVIELEVPLIIESSIGYNWKEMQKF
ncbi:MAG: DNA polymerase I [Candidatus Moranbacteria bacterium]|nr:DNA polymerase I [Candidatus Moranbacteria bacterium]